jgi:hypothetical protein
MPDRDVETIRDLITHLREEKINGAFQRTLHVWKQWLSHKFSIATSVPGRWTPAMSAGMNR